MDPHNSEHKPTHHQPLVHHRPPRTSLLADLCFAGGEFVDEVFEVGADGGVVVEVFADGVEGWGEGGADDVYVAFVELAVVLR